MIGHRQIIAARMRRQRPTLVELVIGPAPAPTRLWHPEGELAEGCVPAVWTDTIAPDLADLRFLRGLTVSVLGQSCSAEAWGRWWDAIVAVEPALLIGIDPHTDEVATWPQ
jgi:hypothetical protein